MIGRRMEASTKETLSPNVGLKDGVLWDFIPSVESDKRAVANKADVFEKVVQRKLLVEKI